MPLPLPSSRVEDSNVAASAQSLASALHPADYDVAVIGGGIVGLAVACEWLNRRPKSRVILLEKESQVAVHQTGRNSGVVHSGIYYKPGSLKAQLCVSGAAEMLAFCQRESVPHEVCGKVVVAVSKEELPRLAALHEQAKANGIKGVSLIGPERLRELEPAATGIKALHVPGAAIVDFSQVAQALVRQLKRSGGVLSLRSEVLRIARKGKSWSLETSIGAVHAHSLVVCGGLYADRLTAAAGARSDLAIVPFRGEYAQLVPNRRSLVKGLIYPVPDPSLPFLGVHLTRTLDGRVLIGPNAIPALKREGYRRWDISLRDTASMLAFPGTWRLMSRYTSQGLAEGWRALSRRALVRAIQKLVPEIHAGDLEFAPSGVRAQAVDVQGRLVHDFQIQRIDGAHFVQNAPSPAATASLAIAQTIVTQALGDS